MKFRYAIDPNSSAKQHNQLDFFFVYLVMRSLGCFLAEDGDNKDSQIFLVGYNFLDSIIDFRTYDLTLFLYKRNLWQDYVCLLKYAVCYLLIIALVEFTDSV